MRYFNNLVFLAIFALFLSNSVFSFEMAVPDGLTRVSVMRGLSGRVVGETYQNADGRIVYFYDHRVGNVGIIYATGGAERPVGLVYADQPVAEAFRALRAGATELHAFYEYGVIEEPVGRLLHGEDGGVEIIDDLAAEAAAAAEAGAAVDAIGTTPTAATGGTDEVALTDAGTAGTGGVVPPEEEGLIPYPADDLDRTLAVAIAVAAAGGARPSVRIDLGAALLMPPGPSR